MASVSLIHWCLEGSMVGWFWCTHTCTSKPTPNRLLCPLSSSWPRSTWSSWSTRPSQLTARSTSARTYLTCLWITVIAGMALCTSLTSLSSWGVWKRGSGPGGPSGPQPIRSLLPEGWSLQGVGCSPCKGAWHAFVLFLESVREGCVCVCGMGGHVAMQSEINAQGQLPLDRWNGRSSNATWYTLNWRDGQIPLDHR